MFERIVLSKYIQCIQSDFYVLLKLWEEISSIMSICNCIKIYKYLMIKYILLWPSLASSNHQNTTIYIILDSETTPVWLNPFELEFPAFYATWHSNRFNSATPLKKCGNIRLYRSLTKLFSSSGKRWFWANHLLLLLLFLLKFPEQMTCLHHERQNLPM